MVRPLQTASKTTRQTNRHSDLTHFLETVKVQQWLSWHICTVHPPIWTLVVHEATERSMPSPKVSCVRVSNALQHPGIHPGSPTANPRNDSRSAATVATHPFPCRLWIECSRPRTTWLDGPKKQKKMGPDKQLPLSTFLDNCSERLWPSHVPKQQVVDCRKQWHKFDVLRVLPLNRWPPQKNEWMPALAPAVKFRWVSNSPKRKFTRRTGQPSVSGRNVRNRRSSSKSCAVKPSLGIGKTRDLQCKFSMNCFLAAKTSPFRATIKRWRVASVPDGDFCQGCSSPSTVRYGGKCSAQSSLRKWRTLSAVRVRQLSMVHGKPHMVNKPKTMTVSFLEI